MISHDSAECSADPRVEPLPEISLLRSFEFLNLTKTTRDQRQGTSEAGFVNCLSLFYGDFSFAYSLLEGFLYGMRSRLTRRDSQRNPEKHSRISCLRTDCQSILLHQRTLGNSARNPSQNSRASKTKRLVSFFSYSFRRFSAGATHALLAPYRVTHSAFIGNMMALFSRSFALSYGRFCQSAPPLSLSRVEVCCLSCSSLPSTRINLMP